MDCSAVTDRAARDLLTASEREEQASFNLATCKRPFVSAAELASYLVVDARTIRGMIAAGSLPGSVRVGRNWRIPSDVAREVFHVPQVQAS